MVNQKSFAIILLTLSLIGLAGFAMLTGNTISTGMNTSNTAEQEKTLFANADLSGPQITGTLFPTESRAAGSTFSGEVLTCTNLTDFEQVIDLKISNLDSDSISVSIVYPFSRTVELLPDQIMRIDLPLPYAVSSIILFSNDEKLILQVPPCISRGGSSGSSSPAERPFHPPPPVPELSTIALTGIGVFGLIFIISRSKQ